MKVVIFDSLEKKRISVRKIEVPDDPEMEALWEEFGITETAEVLGMETTGGVCTPIISRGHTTPAGVTRIFSTAEDNQRSIEIHLLMGNSSKIEECRTLLRAIINDIPKAPLGVPQIAVEFSVDKEGFVEISGKDLATGKVMPVEIKGG